jgi:hypothetical protein
MFTIFSETVDFPDPGGPAIPTVNRPGDFATAAEYIFVASHVYVSSILSALATLVNCTVNVNQRCLSKPGFESGLS